MIGIGSAALRFSCTAVIASSPVKLRWIEVHEYRTLVLLFESLRHLGHEPDYLSRLATAVRQADVRARMALVCRDSLEEVLTWAVRHGVKDGPGTPAFPLIVDPDERLAFLYDLLPANGLRLRGHFVIDPEGIVQQMTVSRIPLEASVDDLVRIIRGCHGQPSSGPWN